ncbi:uncharacterized protein LOC108142718 [Drosophila elegans]|uniref:uncharacterized protein LOC108142718 n=1 Tax=Drosophila elegans TaxID=30023 RepID=UPI0007E5E3FD|nr:uncharacterized protein LOC108142718 [Drosophila elegans]
MDKLIILGLFLWTLQSLALPIIDPDDSLTEMCLPCQKDWDWPTCDKVVVEVERGNGMPGTCCPRYECRDEEPVCNGSKLRFYKNKCTLCDPCEPHAVQCKEICQLEEPLANCLTDDEEYKQEGEIWTENNGCTTCTCLGEKTSCETYQCNQVECSNPISIEGECCLICPDELDENGLYYGRLPLGGTTKGPKILEGESSYPKNSFDTTTQSSTSNPAINESSLVYNFTSPTESTTLTPVTSEFFSTDIVSSETPDLKNTSDDVDISSSDSTTENTTNPTTSSDLKSYTDSSTSIESSTSTDDHVPKTDVEAETTKGNIDDKTTEILLNDFGNLGMTDHPIAAQPAAAAVAPESTSQVKVTSDTEDPLSESTPKTYAVVPQEQNKSNFLWALIFPLIICLGLSLSYTFWKFCCLNSKHDKFHMSTKKNDSREIEALVVIPVQTKS